jgi:hypothetical protein
MVLALVEAGHNDCQISRLTGIPRRTVLDWRHGRSPQHRHQTCALCDGSDPDKSDMALPTRAYAYVLGLYLGDGCISRHPRTYVLRFALDAAYPGVVAECMAALEELMPGKQAWHRRRSTSRCIDVAMYSNHWPCLIPQHGPGRKHHRPIVLAPWQEHLLDSEHEAFLRGLIHSDGCRVVANDRGVASVRYHFANRSEDIKALFCLSLDALGIRWTRPCDRQIAVYRKASVQALDGFIGPKA